MLRGLRNASSGWVGKAIMAAVVGFLIISFAIWGIGDIFRGGGRQTVATIGSAEISADQFRQVFNDRLQQISRQAGKPITPAQAQMFGFDQQMLGQMIAESALDQEAAKLKLGVSDADISKQVMADPSFRGLSGSFDRSRFEQVIRQAGYTEPRYVAEQRRVVLRRQLAGAVNADIKVSGVEAQAFNRFQNEQRSAQYVTLTRATAGEIGTPSPEVLQKYFDDRKLAFRAPEYRKIAVLTLSGDEIAKTIKISDEEAKKVYEERKEGRYSSPEKRDVQQIVFPTEDEAKAAAAKLASGSTFEQIAAERNLKPGDITLTGATKTSIIDPAVADAAFALKPNEVSQPVKGRFGYALLKVTKIEPARVSPYEEVAADIKQDLASEQAREKAGKLRDRIEDELAGGSRLDEVATKIGIPARTIEAVDRSGRGPDGKPVQGLPTTDILNGAFSSDVGIENDAVQIPGGFVYYDVLGITAPRDRTLDEVRDQVVTRWREDEITERLKKKSEDMVAKLKSGTPLDQLASENSLKVETATAIKRNATDPLPSAAVGEIFKTPKDQAGASEGKDAVERIVFRVTDVTTPAFDANSADAKTIVDTLRNAISDELLGQYVSQVESNLGMTVNRAALNQAISGGSGGN
jgi:peptidyl-prolyl cis-trans isomerase D